MAGLSRASSLVGGKAPDPGPAVLKDYQFTNKLGQGTYANVYKAYKKGITQNFVAIKCILLSSLTKSAQDNIVTEIEILKKINSEYIVQLIDFLWDANYIYLIMEYCPGGDLSHFIRQRKRIPEYIVKRFLQQIATAMKVLRKLNICHMDLKPQNILLSSTKDPKLKIADFGFAQYLGNKDEATSLRGSPLYMAPEILLKHQYDARVDLWSIGIILFECLFGKAPYSSDTFAELAEKIKCDKPIEIPTAIDLSDECVDLLTRLLQRNPSQRITFDEFFAHAFVDLEHMPSSYSYERGLSLIRDAVEKDERGQCERASQLYFEGLLYLVPHVQCESNVQKRRVLRLKVTEYMDRAELLRNRSRESEDDEATDSVPNTEAFCNTREDLLANILSNNDSLSEAFAKSHVADEQMMAGNYSKALALYKQALNVIVPLVKALPAGPKREVLHYEASNWLRKGEEAKSCVAIQKLKMKDVAEAIKKGEDVDEISTLSTNCSIQ